jgi:ornithine decarboxylase
MWIDTLDYVSSTWHHCIEAGFDLSVLNIGGGFPAFYGVEVTETSKYIDTLAGYIEERFGSVPYLMIEPGRGLVANLGSIAAEVLLVSHKTMGDPIRWVYLNIGRFSGLAETEQEAIKYQLIVPGKEKHAKSECIIAGPTCDSADVLYEKHKVMMPTDLRSGDKVIINNTGAYTTTYSTVCFNGFPPLDIIII